MKQVWKCDFCSQTSVNGAVIHVHENRCSFNPAAKKCFTCKNQTCIDPWSQSMSCSAGVQCDTQDDVLHADIPCDKWTPES